MQKLLLTCVLIFGITLLSGCETKPSWQGAYFSGGTQDSNLIHSPIFTSFEKCKDWAISNQEFAREGYSYCSKNCQDADDGTPVCEEIITCYDENGGRCSNYEGENEDENDEYSNEEEYNDELYQDELYNQEENNEEA